MQIEILNRQRGHDLDRHGLAVFLDRLVHSESARGDAYDSLTVCLVGDRRMRALNARFRGRDRTTDVLSFPQDGEAAPDGTRHLGDIVISVPRAADQARRAGHSLDRELRVLALHGYLHLLGFDHETDDGAMLRLQRQLERRLLRQPEVAR